MKIGIMGAMLEEVSEILQAMKDVRETEVGSRIFYEGTLEETPVVLAFRDGERSHRVQRQRR